MLDPVLHIHLFGTAHMVAGHYKIAEFPTEKVKFLFFYLALFHQEEHPRAVLQGLFWGDRPEARAKHSLRTELWRLRQWLKSLTMITVPELVIQNSQLQLVLDRSCWLDTYEFEQSIKRANRLQAAAPDLAATFLRRAVELYRGHLLVGCYEDWCLAERERLRQLFLDALARLMLYYDNKRDFSQALDYGQRLLQEEPLREDIHRALIRFYAENEQIPQAIAQYYACETVLSRELHIEPEPETQELYHRLITGKYKLLATIPATSAETAAPTVEEFHALALRVQNALQQLDMTRHELNETLRLMSQLRPNSPGGKEPTQSL